MRGTKAKAIRRAVYGERSTRFCRFFRASPQHGQLVRDEWRRRYQAAKRVSHG